MTQVEQRQRIQFKYQADANSPEGQVYHYLLRNTSFPQARGKEKANLAMTAWWLPFAVRELNPNNAEVARRCAIEAIELLNHHCQRLRREFGLAELQSPKESGQPPIDPVLYEAIATLLHRFSELPTSHPSGIVQAKPTTYCEPASQETAYAEFEVFE